VLLPSYGKNSGKMTSLDEAPMEKSPNPLPPRDMLVPSSAVAAAASNMKPDLPSLTIPVSEKNSPMSPVVVVTAPVVETNKVSDTKATEAASSDIPPPPADSPGSPGENRASVREMKSALFSAVGNLSETVRQTKMTFNNRTAGKPVVSLTRTNSSQRPISTQKEEEPAPEPAPEPAIEEAVAEPTPVVEYVPPPPEPEPVVAAVQEEEVVVVSTPEPIVEPTPEPVTNDYSSSSTYTPYEEDKPIEDVATPEIVVESVPDYSSSSYNQEDTYKLAEELG
jgi:hypothetical protein